MAKRVFNMIAAASMLFILVATYLSGAMLSLLGIGYFRAVKNNPDSVADYTQTSSFRRVTGEYMDALYAAVSGESPLELPYDDEIAFFAYGLDTNRVYCSDMTVFDMPSFDKKYMDSASYIYYLKYSSGNFRGSDKASGVTQSFEYSYTDAANLVFGNEQKYYSDAAMIVAVLPPDFGLTGYRYSRVEFFLLKNGAQLLFVTLGVFLVCLSVIMGASRRRKMVDRFIANLFLWVFFEFKVGFAALMTWIMAGQLLRGDIESFWVTFVLTFIPVFYIGYCGVRYHRGKFFRLSLCLTGYDMIKSLFDVVAPVSDAQVRFRRRAIALMSFGVMLPVLFFTLSCLLFDASVIRVCLGIYIVIFCVIEIFVFRRYGKLLNDVCNLTNLTSVFALGGRLPETDFHTHDDIAQLAENLRAFDSAVDAAAEMKFRKSSKRFYDISNSLDELKMQVDILQDMISEPEDNISPDVQSRARHIADLIDGMQISLLQDTPIMAPVLKRMDLLDVMDDVLNAKIAEFSAAKLKLNVDIPDPPAYITADYAHIRTAFDILFTNTALYARSGTEVDISLVKDDQNWIYVISNEESPYTNVGSAGAAISTGMTMAREYISINGGTLSKTSSHGRYTVRISLPAAR
ncbi:MAG: HAMP domain-containing histidine kinase [Clostridia bacterium]|nr:HAMP domain-containing histidine kinase [Clostridia bacterium]